MAKNIKRKPVKYRKLIPSRDETQREQTTSAKRNTNQQGEEGDN